MWRDWLNLKIRNRREKVMAMLFIAVVMTIVGYMAGYADGKKDK